MKNPHDANENESKEVGAQRIQQDPLIGAEIGQKYRITELLGRGGMAVVYKGQQLNSDRDVAIKTLTVNKPDAIKQFEQEVRVHGQLQHENIVHMLDCVIEANGRPFFVMEYLKGESLDKLLRREGGVRKAEIIHSIFSQLCSAFSYAHEKGVLHRDIKPGNIIVNLEQSPPKVTIIDFGIAHMETLAPIDKNNKVVDGSPIYMSPEQCMGKKMDVRSEVYSLGIILYELIAGEVPYDEASVYEMMSAHCNMIRKPESLAYRFYELSGGQMLDAIIGAALDAEPKNRIRTVAKFSEAMNIWFDCVQKGTTDNLSLVYPIIGDGMFFHDGVQYFDEEEYAETLEGGAVIAKTELKKQISELEQAEDDKEPDLDKEITKLLKKSTESKSVKLKYYSEKEMKARKIRRIKIAISILLVLFIGTGIYLSANMDKVMQLILGSS